MKRLFRVAKLSEFRTKKMVEFTPKDKEFAFAVRDWFSRINGGIQTKGKSFTTLFSLTSNKVISLDKPDKKERPKFFVVDPKFIKWWRPDYTSRNFRSHIIINPEIIELKHSYLKVIKNEKGKIKKIGVDNSFIYKVGDILFPKRDGTNFQIAKRIKVRYQTINIFGKLKTHEHWVDGIISFIFQYEDISLQGKSVYDKLKINQKENGRELSLKPQQGRID